MRRRVTGLIIIALIVISASVIFMAGGFDMPERARAAFSADWRAEMEMTASGVEVEFSPEISGKYDMALFPGEDCHVENAALVGPEGIVAAGTDKISGELVEGVNYTLIVRGKGVCTAELMRHSPGRSIAKSTLIEDGAAGGIIAREGNAGWFRFSTEGGLTAVYIMPGEGVGFMPEGLVYDGLGHVAGESEALENGVCAVYFEADENETYYLRVASPRGGKGMYSVKVVSGGGNIPEEVDFATGDISMRVGDMRAARGRVYPDGAWDELMWFTSDSSVAVVSQEGYITAAGPGEAEISAYGYGGISHRITIEVMAVAPQDIVYTDEEFVIGAGMRGVPHLTVYPLAAAGAEIEYASDDEGIAAIDEDGQVKGISVGETTIHARYGKLHTSLKVVVEKAPARRRALIIGQQMYAPEVNTVRTGSLNTVYSMEALLATAMFENGVGYEIQVELDPSREDTVLAISEAFAGAGDEDVSIFYITCHGDYRNGEAILQFCDGSEMTAGELEFELRKIPGTVVVMIDCCDSGGFVGTYERMSSFTGGIMAAFSGGQAPFAGSKYKVLASAAIDQDSYRIGFGSGEGEAATVFARAMCDGLGWDIATGERGSLDADSNHDGKITLWETYLYASRRVNWYLDMADGGTGRYMQDVQVYPEGDMFVLFER